MKRNLEQLVPYVRNIGEQLVKYNFPNADPELEDSLNHLKSHKVRVDGYCLTVNFSRADYKTHYVETLHLVPDKTPFLPFYLVQKIAKRFLGPNHLSLVEIYRDNQKIYCWNVVLDRRGRPIQNPSAGDAESLTFEGFKYKYMDPKDVNIY